MSQHQPEQGQHTYTNQLIHETSPYLLQHAHNPVNWYAWNDEALQKAKQEDKPILLSVGYSACHWCHVMAHESFENEQIAALMNQHFVSIKVDREERPDIDGIYMQALQAMTRQGGWPMTMFLLPDGRPFYGGTYFPPDDRRYGSQTMPGFPRTLLSVANAYENHRQEIEEQATQIADYLHQRSDAPIRRPTSNIAPSTTTLDMLNDATNVLAREFDEQNGGFGNEPKFPHPDALEFLLHMHLHRLKGEISTPAQLPELEMVEVTLRAMANGGIYDQLGGGFHRYSVDEEWLVPHFEKMLYDNALLSSAYLHTYLATGIPFYRRIAEETLDYIVHEMTSPEGGFYSTQDADSEGVEGKFFLWTPEQIRAVLSPEDAAVFMPYYDVTGRGNFEGKSILHVQPRARDEEESVVSDDTLEETLKRCRAQLFEVREQRIKPGRDEKILTSWNGLMLRSFAEAARYLGRADYLQVAERNAEFLLTKLRKDGRLLRTYKDGNARLNGYLEDYAFLADGLLALYEATFDVTWFDEARTLADAAITLFADEQNGGFFDTGSDHETLISRPKEIMDNAIPAGNSVIHAVLLRLAAFTGETGYRTRAEEYLQPLTPALIQHPQAFGRLLCALDFALSASKEIAIIGNTNVEETNALLAIVNRQYLPNSVLASSKVDDTRATQTIALLADRPLKDEQATVYVCRNFACQAPVNTAEELRGLL